MIFLRLLRARPDVADVDDQLGADRALDVQTPLVDRRVLHVWLLARMSGCARSIVLPLAVLLNGLVVSCRLGKDVLGKSRRSPASVRAMSKMELPRSIML